MPNFEIHKSENYTHISTYHLKEKSMSLKAKGLLTLMLSLPDCWDYSIKGLVAICKESESAIISTLTELKQFGYLIIEKQLPNQTKSGRFEYVYHIYESAKQEPKIQDLENQGLEFQHLEFQHLENRGLNENNNEFKINNNIKKNNNIKHIYGAYKNVLLTEEEHAKLCNLPDGADAIEYLSEYMAYKEYKAKSHYLAIKKWVFDALKEDKMRKDKLNGKSRFTESDRPIEEILANTHVLNDEELGNVEM